VEQEAAVAAAMSPADGVPRPVVEGAVGSVTGKVQAARHAVRPPLPPEPEEDEPAVVTIEAEEPPSVPADHDDESDVRAAFDGRESPLHGRTPRMVSFGDEPTSPTGPMRILKEIPPELSPRAGEVRVRTESDATPLLADNDLPAVVIREQREVKSEPILLERRSRGSSQPPLETGEEAAVPEAPSPEGAEDKPAPDEEVLVLDRPKRTRARRSTNVGLGRLSSSPAIPRPDLDESEAEMLAANKAIDNEATPPSTPRARMTRPSPADTIQDPVPVHIHDDETERNPTGKFQRIEYADLDDDEFGPPGSTIPPAYLGAMPDTEELADREAIPLLIDASGITGRVASPPAAREKAKDVTDLAATLQAAAEAQRALEVSSQKLIETLRRLDVARTRDEVIDSLLDHLIETFACVSFFVVKSGKLSSFRSKGIGEREINERSAELALDKPSTLQDVVRSRLPFHGPLPDQTSRAFAAALLGEEPEEILAMPCAVRDRVVGVLFGSHRRNKRIIQEHVAVVLRAAGQALERILRARKGSVPGTEPPI